MYVCVCVLIRYLFPDVFQLQYKSRTGINNNLVKGPSMAPEMRFHQLTAHNIIHRKSINQLFVSENTLCCVSAVRNSDARYFSYFHSHTLNNKDASELYQGDAFMFKIYFSLVYI